MIDDRRKYSPKEAANLNGTSSSKNIGQVPRDESTEPGSSGHGRRNTSLSSRIRPDTLALVVERRLVEVALIRLSGDAAKW